MTDQRWDTLLNLVLRVAFVAAVLAIGILSTCKHDTLTDCSRRGKPQHWDGARWTCDRDQR